MNVVSVTFDGHTFYVVDCNGEAWAPIKPITDALKLDWDAIKQWTMDQSTFGARLIVFPSIESVFETVCIPLRKIHGWLLTIDSDISPLNGLDDALYEGWTASTTKPMVPNGRVLLTIEHGRICLAQALPDDWLVAPLDGFHELAARSGLMVMREELHSILYESRFTGA